jgi:Glycosyltransferase family 28 C-terminal domain
VIGWYVHHRGAGHLQQLRLVSKHLRSPVAGLSSLARPRSWAGGWVTLPPDDDKPVRDVEAGGALHWAPKLHEGLLRRNATIVRWIERTRPALMVVDVSVEVALLSRLLGIPVVVAAMRGSRGDRPHAQAYDLADALLAPWPGGHDPPGWPGRWVEKTWHVGAFSQFDGAPRPPRSGCGRRRVLLLAGDGGTDIGPEAVGRARAATLDWSWTVAGVGGRLDRGEVWSALCESDVVIAHAGQSAVAEVAAARRPAIIVAQQRPHDEQIDTAFTLQRAGIAIGLDRWPPSAELPRLLGDALTLDPSRWSTWSPGDGAQTAAGHLDRLAHRLDSARLRCASQ